MADGVPEFAPELLGRRPRHDYGTARKLRGEWHGGEDPRPFFEGHGWELAQGDPGKAWWPAMCLLEGGGAGARWGTDFIDHMLLVRWGRRTVGLLTEPYRLVHTGWEDEEPNVDAGCLRELCGFALRGLPVGIADAPGFWNPGSCPPLLVGGMLFGPGDPGRGCGLPFSGDEAETLRTIRRWWKTHRVRMGEIRRRMAERQAEEDRRLRARRERAARNLASLREGSGAA